MLKVQKLIYVTVHSDRTDVTVASVSPLGEISALLESYAALNGNNRSLGII